jgi:hypothetical protein
MFSPVARLQENPLWDREFRSGRRLWLLQSWPLPIAVLLAYGCHFVLGNPAAAEIHVNLLGGSVYASPYEIALLLWAVWLACHAMARDSTEAGRSTLGLMVVSPRSIAIAKSFGACYPALLALWGLLLVRGLSLLSAATAGEGIHLGEFEALPALSIGHWYLNMLFVEGDWWFIWEPLDSAIYFIEVAARLLLFPLVILTFAGWLAVRLKSAIAPFAITVALAAALLAGAICLFHGLASMSGVSAPISANIEPSPFVTLIAVCLALAFTLLIHLLLPAAWLLWWWRWTGHGFQRDYLQGPEDRA